MANEMIVPGKIKPDGKMDGSCPSCGTEFTVIPTLGESEDDRATAGEKSKPGPIPVLWLKKLIYPHNREQITLSAGKGDSIERLEQVIEEIRQPTKPFATVLLKDEKLRPQCIDDLIEVATLAYFFQPPTMTPDQKWILVIQSTRKIKLSYTDDTFCFAIPELFKEESIPDSQQNRMFLQKIKNLAEELYISKKLSSQLYQGCNAFNDMANESIGAVLDLIAYELTEQQECGISFEEKIEAFTTPSLEKRLGMTVIFMEKAVCYFKELQKIEENRAEQYNQMVMQQIAANLTKRLGGGKEEKSEADKLREKVESSLMPDEAKQEALKIVQRLQGMPTAHPNYDIDNAYIDWLVKYPWGKRSGKEFSRDTAGAIIADGARILDEDHYGIKKVKERILNYLAVRTLNPETKGPILLFVGPPGVGKTSLGQSIARMLTRKFIRISVGGMRDEAEIKGHRRTYIGALPGKIIQEICRVGYEDPLIMLDEVDKVGNDYRGDPASALLELIDPEQNVGFNDHYFGVVKVDLTKCFFICTANITDTMKPALKDRFEIIELAGYSEHEKLEIAKRHLIPKQLKEHGLMENNNALVEFEDAAIRKGVWEYTREAGVRGLERSVISEVFRKIARKITEGVAFERIVNAGAIPQYLGPPKFIKDDKLDDSIGIATAMFWTEMGGETGPLECQLKPGKGQIILTGNLGKILQESAQAALTYVRSQAKKFEISDKLFRSKDIHIHLASGAIEKDGPSAGVVLALAIVSAFTNQPVKHTVTATGEIMLHGQVLKVGGLKDKFLAALRDGIEVVFYPHGNKPMVEEILADPDNHELKKLKLIPIKHVDEVLKEALLPKKRRQK